MCATFGVLVTLGIGWLITKGVKEVIRTARHPHGRLYSNNSSDVIPLLTHSDEFDVYFAVWARLPDRAQPPPPVEHRFDSTLDRMMLKTGFPAEEIIRDAEEECIHVERAFSGINMRQQFLHTDITFDVPLEHL